MQKGFTLVEVLIAVAIIAVLVAIAIPMMKDALMRAYISAAATDAAAIHTAYKRYHVDFSEYPDSTVLDTFEPLVANKYYDGRVLPRLLGQRLDGYDSPDDAGTNQEFWLEFTLGSDHTVRFLVADSDNAPLGGGDYFDGIFLFRNNVLTEL